MHNRAHLGVNMPGYTVLAFFLVEKETKKLGLRPNSLCKTFLDSLKWDFKANSTCFTHKMVRLITICSNCMHDWTSFTIFGK